MKLKITILLVLIFSSMSYGQTEIKYQNKSLIKILQRNGINSFSQLSEINIADSLKQQYSVNGKFYKANIDSNKFKYVYIGRVNSCRAGGCSVSGHAQVDIEYEYFDVFVLFDMDKSVQLIKVFNYQATHGYEISAKGWLKQFVGYDGSTPLQVNNNIDAISGATVSVYAITNEIEIKSELLSKLAL